MSKWSNWTYLMLDCLVHSTSLVRNT